MEGAGTSCIVNERLHVFDRRGECERPDATGLAIERPNVVAARRPVLKHKHLTAALITQVEQLIAGAPEEAGQIEISSLEGALANRAFVPWVAGGVCS